MSVLEPVVLRAGGVTHYFQLREARVQALRDINLDIRLHEFVSLLGPTGCGKTTLLRTFAGLVIPSEGAVYFGGHPVTKPPLGIAMVFQGVNLLPWRTVKHNIAFGLEVQKIPRPERERLVAGAIQMVGLDGFANAYPNQLSGGMKQRVGIARALCTKPDVLLMDEPFGSLDPMLREVMQIELLKLWERDKKTVVFVTHSIEEAILLSDRIVLLSFRPAVVKEIVTIDLPRPRDAEDIRNRADFLAYRNHIWQVLKPEVQV